MQEAAGDASARAWDYIEHEIKRERGILGRLHRLGRNSMGDVILYLSEVEDTSYFLDAVEIGFRTVQLEWDLDYDDYVTRQAVLRVNDSMAELNGRFSQHDLGYAFSGWPGIITRLDSQYIHAEVVESAIHQLRAAGWGGPLDEFMEAHRQYRHGNNKAAMNDALKAFESTMKAIFQARQWEYQENWQAKRLIQALFDNQLLPKFA